jgi:hypothetical protein
MKEALSSSETSVLTRATRRNNPEDPHDSLLSSYFEFRTIDKPTNPLILSVIHPRRNPFESTFT